MVSRVLEVNVDDIGYGGVFSLVKNVIENKPESLEIDIAAIEKFENPNNISLLKTFGTNVYYVGKTSNKALKQVYTFVNLRKIIKKYSFDCVHIHADTANKLLISGLAAKTSGVKKIILHSHASGVDGKNRAFKKIIHYICRPLLKYIGTTFVACSDLAEAWMFPNISKGQIVEIKNGIDLKKFEFNSIVRDYERKQLKVQPKELLIGHVGRFAYQKNHEFLIEIMKKLKEKKIDAKLLLVGEGPKFADIRQLSKNQKLEDRIIFYGISNNVCQLYQAMDIFVLPSHFEGLPIVGVEAQASGVKTIFSNEITKEAALLPSTKFLPISGVNAIDQWVDEILRGCESDRTKAVEYIKNQNFDISDTIQSFINLYTGTNR